MIKHSLLLLIIFITVLFGCGGTDSNRDSPIDIDLLNLKQNSIWPISIVGSESGMRCKMERITHRLFSLNRVLLFSMLGLLMSPGCSKQSSADDEASMKASPKYFILLLEPADLKRNKGDGSVVGKCSAGEIAPVFSESYKERAQGGGFDVFLEVKCAEGRGTVLASKSFVHGSQEELTKSSASYFEFKEIMEAISGVYAAGQTSIDIGVAALSKFEVSVAITDGMLLEKLSHPIRKGSSIEFKSSEGKIIVLQILDGGVLFENVQDHEQLAPFNGLAMKRKR